MYLAIGRARAGNFMERFLKRQTVGLDHDASLELK